MPEVHPLFDLYYHELLWLAHRIKKGCEAIFEATTKNERGHYIQVSIPVHEDIEAVCLAAARLKKLVQTPSSKFGHESPAAYRVRQLRARALREVLDSVGLDELLKTKARDSIEHFDEYLDAAYVQVTTGKIPSPWAAYNMTLSDSRTMNPPPYPIRIYLAEERKFQNMRFTIDLGKVHKEASAIVERLASLGTFPSEPGALIIKFPQEGGDAKRKQRRSRPEQINDRTPG
jgi:hypothetical protein